MKCRKCGEELETLGERAEGTCAENRDRRFQKLLKRRIEDKEEMLERGKAGNDPGWSSDKKHALRSMKKELENVLEIVNEADSGE